MKKFILFIVILGFAQFCFSQSQNHFISNHFENKKNSISLSLFNPLNGENVLFYERTLNPKVTFELGVGVTKWLPVTVSAMLCSNTFQGYQVEKSKIGAYLAPSLKYYPFGQNKGFHLSAGALYKQFNYNVLDNENTIKKAYRKDFDKLRLAVGYTQQWGRFVGEFQVGAASRNTVKTPSFQSNEGYFSESGINSSTIQGFINCKIGYKF